MDKILYKSLSQKHTVYYYLYLKANRYKSNNNNKTPITENLIINVLV